MWFGPKISGVPDPPTEPPEAGHTCGDCEHFRYSPGDTDWGVCVKKTIESYDKGDREDFVEWQHEDDGYDCDGWEQA